MGYNRWVNVVVTGGTVYTIIIIGMKVCKLCVLKRKNFALLEAYWASIERRKRKDEIVTNKLSQIIRMLRRGTVPINRVIQDLIFMRNIFSDYDNDIESSSSSSSSSS